MLFPEEQQQRSLNVLNSRAIGILLAKQEVLANRIYQKAFFPPLMLLHMPKRSAYVLGT